MIDRPRYDGHLELPAVYPILDTALLARLDLPLVDCAEALAEGGARILQIRHKGLWTREDYHAATELASYCRAAGILLVVNDRADIARMLGAGVHIGQDDLPPSESRVILGDALIGFSTHNEAQLRASVSEPIDYVALGPIFKTGSKENPDPVVGVAELKRLRGMTTRPLVAIGGITLEAAAEVWQAGANSIALISDLFRDPAKSAIRARMEAWLRQSAVALVP